MNNSRKVRVLVDSYAVDLEIDMKVKMEDLVAFIRNEDLLSDFCADEDLELLTLGGKKLSLQDNVENL